MNEEAAHALRAPFPPEMVGKLPRAGIQLDYVGHAAVTDRLLKVDPAWTWEPLAYNEAGTPLVLIDGNNAVMWIKLTVRDVTRLGVGIVGAQAFELQKQLISDALRNAAMRFGVALDLWSKEGLSEAELPPATPMATKADVDALSRAIDELDDDDRSAFLAWKSDQGFTWPWSQAALEAMHDELAQIVGDSGEPAEAGTDDHPSAASPDADTSVGFSGEPF